jgi:hypothetical protein
MTSKPLSEALEEAFIQSCNMDSSLAERLQAFADAVRRLGPHFQDAVDRLVSRLREHEVGENAPRLGEPMPSFVLPDETGQLVTLEQLLKRGPLAITFHRGHWCPYCRINTRALAEAQGEIEAEGAQIAAIMPDQQHFTAEFKAESDSLFHRQWLCDVLEPRVLGRRRDAAAHDQRGLGCLAVPGRPHLAAADPRHLRHRHRRGGQSALHRSRLSETRGG